jgi:hypothetical protein
MAVRCEQTGLLQETTLELLSARLRGKPRVKRREWCVIHFVRSYYFSMPYWWLQGIYSSGLLKLTVKNARCRASDFQQIQGRTDCGMLRLFASAKCLYIFSLTLLGSLYDTLMVVALNVSVRCVSYE